MDNKVMPPNRNPFLLLSLKHGGNLPPWVYRYAFCVQIDDSRPSFQSICHATRNSAGFYLW